MFALESLEGLVFLVFGLEILHRGDGVHVPFLVCFVVFGWGVHLYVSGYLSEFDRRRVVITQVPVIKSFDVVERVELVKAP